MRRICSSSEVVDIVWVNEILLFFLVLIFDEGLLELIILVKVVFPPLVLFRIEEAFSLCRNQPIIIHCFPCVFHINSWDIDNVFRNIALPIHKRYLLRRHSRLKRLQPNRSFLIPGAHPSRTV